MSFDFNEVLDMRAEDIKRPPAMPKGPYTWKIDKQPSRITKGSEDEWEIIEFPVSCVEASDLVDAGALEEFGPVANTKRRVSFMFSNKKDDESAQNNKKAADRLKRFLVEHLQIADGSSKTIKELMAESPGHMFLGFVDWRPDPNDNEVFYDEIKKTAPLD